MRLRSRAHPCHRQSLTAAVCTVYVIALCTLLTVCIVLQVMYYLGCMFRDKVRISYRVSV